MMPSARSAASTFATSVSGRQYCNAFSHSLAFIDFAASVVPGAFGWAWGARFGPTVGPGLALGAAHHAAKAAPWATVTCSSGFGSRPAIAG